MNEDFTSRTEISELGEFGLIDHLTKQSRLKNISSLKGVGDDAAVIKSDGKVLLVSTDLMVEGIHFDLMYNPLKHLGYKAVISNLSDIYAMNGSPTQITVSMALSSKFSVEAIEEIYEGIHLACKLYNVDLVGGDTSASPMGLFISITVIGEAVESNICYRDGAKPGDIICATGDFGAAYLGLQILEREKQLYLNNPGIQPDLEDQSYVIQRQLKPEARKDSIAYFEKIKLKPTSMIDVSDGLASDLFHICESSGVGAYLEEVKVPIHPQAEELAIKFRMNPISCALSGGEDYELLFTVAENDLEKVRYMPDVSIIGEIIPKEDGINLHTTGGKIHPITAQGWRHFRSAEDPAQE